MDGTHDHFRFNVTEVELDVVILMQTGEGLRGKDLLKICIPCCVTHVLWCCFRMHGNNDLSACKKRVTQNILALTCAMDLTSCCVKQYNWKGSQKMQAGTCVYQNISSQK